MKSETRYLDVTEMKRWMLVDDNEEILLMLSAMVEKLTGAPVECYDSPASALAAFAAKPEAYDLVITDFAMPGMNGVELCGQMHARTPAQKVMLVTSSGFTSATARAAGFCALLQKPFPVVALQEAIAGAGLKTENRCSV
jgi:CheY-like chemotaxis protein